MYTLSRLLPDNSLRPISAGMTASDTDTLACEVLPGETIVVGEAIGHVTMLVCTVGLDETGALQFVPDQDHAVQFAMTLRGQMRMAVVEQSRSLRGGLVQVAQVTVNLFEDDDTRLFVQVFPVPVEADALPVG